MKSLTVGDFIFMNVCFLGYLFGGHYFFDDHLTRIIVLVVGHLSTWAAYCWLRWGAG